MYLLDTNVVSELRKVRAGRSDPGVATWADQVEPGSLFLSTITLHELELGVLLIERRDAQQGASYCGSGWSRRCCPPLAAGSWWWMLPWPVAARPSMCLTRSHFGMA